MTNTFLKIILDFDNLLLHKILLFYELQTYIRPYKPKVNSVKPMHIRTAAVKSSGPYRLPCIRMLPASTGISLQLLKMTCVG